MRRSVERDSLLLPTAQHRHLDELYRQLSLGKRQRKREVRLVPASWPSRRDPHRKCRSAGRFPAQADKRTRYPILARYPISEHHMRRRIRKVLGLDLPRFRGEMRAWDQALWLYVILSSGSWHSLVRPPAEPFFRPDPCTDAAAARSGGQGRPLPAAARRACP